MTRTTNTTTATTFAIGTIVAPKANADTEYSVCGNSVLQKAKVVKTFALDSKGNNMSIEILAHTNPEVIGKKYKVNSEYFEAVAPELSPAPEGYVWIDAYKGTDKDMKCKGVQYEMDVEKTYSGKIVLGSKGYHVCGDLAHCFKTYDYDFSNRFFKVKALVKANAYEYMNPANTTLVAKSIKFIEEITDTDALTAKRASIR